MLQKAHAPCNALWVWPRYTPEKALHKTHAPYQPTPPTRGAAHTSGGAGHSPREGGRTALCAHPACEPADSCVGHTRARAAGCGVARAPPPRGAFLEGGRAGEAWTPAGTRPGGPAWARAGRPRQYRSVGGAAATPPPPARVCAFFTVTGNQKKVHAPTAPNQVANQPRGRGIQSAAWHTRRGHTPRSSESCMHGDGRPVLDLHHYWEPAGPAISPTGLQHAPHISMPVPVTQERIASRPRYHCRMPTGSHTPLWVMVVREIHTYAQATVFTRGNPVKRVKKRGYRLEGRCVISQLPNCCACLQYS